MNGAYFFHPSWPVLYEDNHLLGLYKPAGLLVQGDRTGEASLLELGKSWLKERCRKPGKVFLGLIHRLDRPVAGALLFCRTSKSAARMSEQFRTKRVRKLYLAVLEGKPAISSDTLVHHIERKSERSSVVVLRPTNQSQEARLSYRTIETVESRSLVEIELETGRHHQIRVQMAHIGHPVLGDLRYGAAAPLPNKQIALFAYRLVFDHPVRKTETTVTCPLPYAWPWPDTDRDVCVPWNWSDLAPFIHLPGAAPPDSGETGNAAGEPPGKPPRA